MRSQVRFVIILLIACAVVSAGETINIPIIVQEPAGIARQSEPVSGGISLPKGVFRPGEVRYQVKVAELPILPYEKWDFRKHAGNHRNWWRAANCSEEPTPRKPGSKEEFVVYNVPKGAVYFAVRSYDDHGNQSAIGNVAKAKQVSLMEAQPGVVKTDEKF